MKFIAENSYCILIQSYKKMDPRRFKVPWGISTSVNNKSFIWDNNKSNLIEKIIIKNT